MLTRILAAGLSRVMDFRMVAPSLVTVIRPVEADSRYVSEEQDHEHQTAYEESCSFPGTRQLPISLKRVPQLTFGPRVDLTKSPRAIAPTKEERRAFSPLSSVA
jgi:hypothetical protein